MNAETQTVTVRMGVDTLSELDELLARERARRPHEELSRSDLVRRAVGELLATASRGGR